MSVLKIPPLKNSSKAWKTLKTIVKTISLNGLIVVLKIGEIKIHKKIVISTQIKIPKIAWVGLYSIFDNCCFFKKKGESIFFEAHFLFLLFYL